MPKLPRLIFIHDGKAHYPSVGANKAYFKDRYECLEMTYEEAKAKGGTQDAILWYMMGFYPKAKLPARLTIHDYKSLSIGRGKGLKDWLKARFNHKPDLRILKEGMEDIYRFNDGIPFVHQDIGVPDSILEYRNKQAAKPEYDFCYFGVMTRERNFDLVLESFLKKYGESSSLLLMGNAEAEIRERFGSHKNIVFTGTLPQQKVFGNILNSRVVVCYFPNHYPHTIQTPTKLLESAALGARILANRQPMNELRAKQYGIEVEWGSNEDIFAEIPAKLDWKDNSKLNIKALLWSAMVKNTGIEAIMTKAVK